MANNGKGHASRRKIRVQYLAGDPPRTIAKNLGITIHQVNYWIGKDGLAAARKRLRAESQEIAIQAETEARDELARRAHELVVEEQRQLAREHYEWARDELEIAKGRIRTDGESQAKLSALMSNLESIDRMARKTFNINGGGQVSDAQRQIAILINVPPPARSAEGSEPKRAEGEVVEAEVTETD